MLDLRGVALALVFGCCACGASSNATPTPVNEGRWPLVRALSSDAFEGRGPGTAGSKKAREAIIAELERCKIPPAPGRDYATPTGGPGVNIIGQLPGSEPHRYLVLSAHYDHLGIHNGEIMNGADDNAAAVGSVIAAACALVDKPRRVTLILALWDTEEPPHFLRETMGSRAWVAHPHVPIEQVEAAVVLDLVGGGLWPGSPVHVALGAESSPALAKAVADTAAPTGLVVAQAGLHLVEELPSGHQPWSDYDAFRAAKVPHLFLSNGQTEHYHTAGDDFATLDLDKLDRQTTWLIALTDRLVNLAERPSYAPSERPEVDREAARALLEGASKYIEGLERDLEIIGKADPRETRVAVQRVQCLAAKQYPRALCMQLGAQR